MGRNRRNTSPLPTVPQLMPEQEYTTPKTGIISWFSDQWRPYVELARFDKPGFALLWIVNFCGVLPAAVMTALPAGDVLKLAVGSIVPCQLLMWFVFAWNDTCDVDLDRRVLRTRHRPLARNALTWLQALAFDGILAAISLSFLLPLPLACRVYAIPMTCGCLVYPLTKRFTNHPQACSGFILASGIYMGAATAGVDALPYPTRVEDVLSPRAWWFPSREVMVAMGSIYFTAVVWITSTEIVYSYQDAEWDEAAGIGTITRLIPNHTSARILLSLLATLQVVLFWFVGKTLEFQSNFWGCSIALTAATLGLTICRVDLGSPESCLLWFQIGNITTGSAMLLGYGIEYLSRT